MSRIRLKPGDNVLVWGASGGLGVFGVQLCAASGANAIGIISDETKREYVMSARRQGRRSTARSSTAGAQMPKVNTPEYDDLDGRRRASSAKRSGTSPASRTSTSCSSIRARRRFRSLASSSSAAAWWCSAPARPGYNITFDARYVWMRQKRIQGSHFAHLKQARAANKFVIDRRIDPVHVRSLSLDEDPARAYQDVEEPARARQHGGAGQRSDDRLAHIRGRDRGRSET